MNKLIDIKILKGKLILFAPILVFIIVALFYFYPVLQGKQIYQSDIIQYIGMSKERNNFRDTVKEEAYWTNSAFGGMPTFQLGANYPHNYIKKLDGLLRFLPRPADYLFLYFIGIYTLLLLLKVDYRMATLGALAFGLSTYLIIILGVGHNAKAHAIGYMPFVLSGMLLIFQGKYKWGFILSALAWGLEIGANHFQMTYYLLILVFLFGIFEIIKNRRRPKKIFIPGIVFIFSILIGLAINAPNILATKQYSEWSTRGKSDLTITPDGNPKEIKEGLDYHYITEYSYGIFESLNLFIPRLVGGASNENVGTNSNSYRHLTKLGVGHSQAKNFVANLPTYWGEQPIVAAPAYVGAPVLFLFILSLFLLKGNLKKWLFTGVIVALLLSWGKNLSILTNAMINYVPFYNKFSAVSSIQVILELCVPILAILGLNKFLDKSTPSEERKKALKRSVIISLSAIIFLLVLQSGLSFSGAGDQRYLEYFGIELLDAIKKDRQSLYNQDVFRTLLFVVCFATLLYFFMKEKISRHRIIILSGLLIMIDLIGVGKRYVNKDDFVSKSLLNKPFKASLADKEIAKDTTTYRVFDLGAGLTGGKPSYFHKAISGYHAAKPMRIQNIFDFYFQDTPNKNILNMFNVKYIIGSKDELVFNDKHNGNAWFIDSLKVVENADQEIGILGKLNSKQVATIEDMQLKQPLDIVYQKDSLSKIQLIDYAPNKLVYNTTNHYNGFAIFSEMYYPKGWKVTIDGKQTSAVYRVNYTLRGLYIPAGKHRVTFKFEPQIIKTGSTIALSGYIIFILVLLGQFIIPHKNIN